MKKYYVLDTNILLQSPGAIYGFEDNTVVITGTTLQRKILMGRLDIMRVRQQEYWKI